jgi:excisionase family DNA binding protein
VRTPVDAALLDALVEQVAERVADAVAERLAASGHDQNPCFTPEKGSNRGQNTGSPWLSADQAAAYIGGAPVSRAYDLVQTGKLKPHRDGRRLVFHRDDLDAYLRGGS